MKKIVLPTLFLLLSCLIHAQTTSMVWAKNLKYAPAYSGASSYPSDIAIDNSGNYYITGNFQGVLDMDPGAATYTIASKGGEDVYLAKYSANGNFIWAKSFGTAGSDVGNALHVVNNKLYVGGTFYDVTFDIDPSAATYTIAGGGSGDYSGFAATFDTSGIFQSAFSLIQCPVFDIKTDNSGNFILGGRFRGASIDLDPGPGVFSQTSTSNSGNSTYDMYYGKYATNGNMFWAKTKGGYYDEATSGLAIDPITGNIAVAGSSNGIYVAVCNSAGTIIKDATMGPGLASDVCFDNSGNFYFSGIYSNVTDLDWDAVATYSLPNVSNQQAFVMKYTSANTFSWAKQIALVSPVNNATGPMMNLDNNNDILLTNRESNSGSASWLVLMKTDHNTGAVIWRNNLTSVCYNGNNGNEGTGIVYSPLDQTVLVTGMIGGSSNGGSVPCQFDADPGSGVYNLSSGSVGTTNYDTFMGKYGSCAGAPSNVSAISGSTVLCSGNTTTYSVSPVSGANSYNWSLPGGWTGSSTSNTISTTVTSSGTISVSATNSCGSSTAQTLPVQVNPVPAQPSSISGAAAFCAGSGAHTYSIAAVSGASSYSWVLPGGWTGSSSSNTIQVNANTAGGILSVSAINSCGNSPAATLSITVNALPSIAISGAGAVCNGSSITLNASGANTYTWSTSSTNSSVSVTPNVNTTYSVTGTDANGCINTAIKTITVNALPSIVISGAGAVCDGSSITLNASGANTYTWSTPSNNSSISVTPTVNTTYSVTGTDANGCINTAIKTITVNALPSVVISGNTYVCAGLSTTLSATGASSYTWSTSDNTSTVSVAPASNTTYSVMGTDANGCNGTAFANVVVNPSLTIIVNGPSYVCAGGSATISASGASSYTWSTSENTGSIVVSPSAFTIYTVTGTDGNGCSGTAYKNITVIALPTVAISGNNTLCAGSNTSLNATGANTYTWSNGSNNSTLSVSPAGTTTYSVTGADATGCENSASITITVNALPLVSIATTSTLLCTGQTATLTASGANTYTWSTGNNGLTQTVSPTSNSTYTLSGTDNNGCTNDAVTTLSVSLCTGIETLSSGNRVILYPNPAKNDLFIESSETISRYVILDMTGKIVDETAELNSSNIRLDLNAYTSGVYTIMIYKEQFMSTLRFIKE